MSFLALQRLADALKSTRLIMQLQNPIERCRPLRPVASIVRELVGGSRAGLGRPLSLRWSGDHSLLSRSWKSMTALIVDTIEVEVHSYCLGE